MWKCKETKPGSPSKDYPFIYKICPQFTLRRKKKNLKEEKQQVAVRCVSRWWITTETKLELKPQNLHFCSVPKEITGFILLSVRMVQSMLFWQTSAEVAQLKWEQPQSRSVFAVHFAVRGVWISCNKSPDYKPGHTQRQMLDHLLRHSGRCLPFWTGGKRPVRRHWRICITAIVLSCSCTLEPSC